MEDRFGYGAIVRAMRPEEREEMLGLLLEAVAGEMPAGAEEEPPEACPRCGCPRTVRRGRDADGAQRRLCRGCGRSFRASTGRVLGTTKQPAATWARYAEAMLAGATLRDAAACGVPLKTSFSMRHRLCEVMASMLPAFEAGPGYPVEGAVVSTDRQRGYVRALAEMGVAAHERFASSGPRAPLNRVNALHSALKAFLARFGGVSTRRLPNYLAWFCWAREARRGGDAASLLRAQMGSGTYRTGWRGLWRQPCPFHPEISMSYAG